MKFCSLDANTEDLRFVHATLEEYHQHLQRWMGDDDQDPNLCRVQTFDRLDAWATYKRDQYMNDVQ